MLCIGYESKATLGLVENFNIKNRDTQEISSEIISQLKEVGIGHKPIIFVSFSMGGLITKQLILNDKDLQSQVKSILFLAVPHFGSSVVDDTMVYMNRALQGYLPFLEIAHTAMTAIEVNENITDFIVPSLSKTTIELCNKDMLPKVQLHKDFLGLGIPFECVAEGTKVYYPSTGMSYMVVKP